VNNDPVNWVDLWGLLQIYADDVNGKPIAVKPVTTTRVNNLTTVQQMTREADMYQQGGGGRYPSNPHLTTTSTFCNQATFDIAVATGFNTDALFKDRDNTNANAAVQNLAAAAAKGTVTQVSPAQAQALANQGYTVIAAYYNTNKNKDGTLQSGHLMTVSPNYSGNNNNDLFVSHVGAKENRIDNASNIPGTYSYYYDPNQRFDKFDPSGVAQRQEKPKKNK
jgi:hypothetical protein